MATDLFAVVDGGAATSAAPLLVVQLPGAPRGKGRPRSRIVQPRGGKPFVHVYSDPETVKYETALAWQAKAAMRGKPPFEGPLAIRVFAIMPIPKSWPARERDAAITGIKFPMTKPDADNIGKLVDAFNGIVWKDDVQVARSLVVKEYGEMPGLIVEIYRLP